MILLSVVGLVLMVLLTVSVVTGSLQVTWGLSNDGEGGASSDTVAVTATGNNPINFDIAVVHNTTNVPHDIYIDTGNLEWLVIVSDKDVTLYTNHASGATPDDTIPLKAGKPWVWVKNNGIAVADVLAGDAGIVSSVYHTNAGATADDDAVVRYRGLQTV